MASYLDKLRDIVENWNDVLEILELNKEHFDIALNECYSEIDAEDYAEEQLMAGIKDELSRQLRIEEMI